MQIKKTVCLIDDDEIYQFLSQEIIERCHHVQNILTFCNGEEAIDYFRSVYTCPSNLPDLILLDLNMPIMDGWGFLQEYITLKPKIEKKITIYIVSSSIDPRDINKAKSFKEVTDFIIKPMTQETFNSLMSN